MLNVIYAKCQLLSVILLNVVMLSVVMLSVVMLCRRTIVLKLFLRY
jgi:hypothetical protein